MRQTIAGQDVWVTRTGDASPHSPRLFVHCSLGAGGTLMPLADALPAAENTFFDLPGHGRSGAWTGTDYHSDILRIMDALITEPAHVVGHSFGATVALRLAIEAPDKVSRLTLIEPVMFAAANGTQARADHATAFAPYVQAMTEGDLDRASEVFTDMWGTGPHWRDLPEKHRQRIRSQMHLVVATEPAIEDDVHRIVGRLDQVTCPVGLIEGADSQPIMSAIMDRLEGGLRNVRRTVIAGADHMVPITHVPEVARAMTRG